MKKMRVIPISFIILFSLIFLINMEVKCENNDDEIFPYKTVFSTSKYFPVITIKDLNLSLDKYHQIDKSKMNKSQQDTIQIGVITPEDYFFDIAVLYKGNKEIMLYRNNGNGTLSPYRILNGVNKYGSIAEAIELIPPEDFIGNPARRCSLKITYNSGSETIVSDIEIARGKSEIFQKGDSKNITDIDMMTLPRGSLVDIGYVQQWKGPRNRACPAGVTVGDVDKDGKNEAIYTFYPDDPWTAFPTRLVVFECVNQSTYRVDWDTTLFHGGYNLNSKLFDMDSDGNLEFFGVGWNALTQNWSIGIWECKGEEQYRFRWFTGLFALPQTIDVKDTITVNGKTGKGFWLCFSNPSEPYQTNIYKYVFNAKGTNAYGFYQTEQSPYPPFFVYSMQAGKFDEDGRDMIVMGQAQWSSYYIAYLDSTGISTNAGYEWKEINLNEPVSGGYVLGKDLEGDGTPEIIAAGIGVGTGTVGVVKHSGSPGENQWQTMWWDSVGIKGMPNNNCDTITWGNKFTFLHAHEFMMGGPYYPHFLTEFITYSVQNLFSFYKTSNTMFDSTDIATAKLFDIDNDGKMNILASISDGLVQADTNWNCLSDYEATGTIGITPISNTVPINYILEQNYPNPFNSETVIKFDIPKSENIEIKMYDMLGREVAVLLNEYKTSGSYKINFNSNLYNLTSGIYFYVLKAGNYSNTKKLVYIK